MTQLGTARLSRPVSDHDHTEGPTTATVELVEYGDYECPYCRAAAPIAQELRRLLGDQLRYVYRHFPAVGEHPRAVRAAEAAEAAGAQGHFWTMHAHLFARQEALADDDLLDYAAALGLDAERFARDLDARTFASRVREDLLSGQESGVVQTPTFYLDGVRYDRQVGLRQLLTAIRDADPEVVTAGAEPEGQSLIPRVVRQRPQAQRPAR